MYERTRQNDIPYRGPFSYRHLRIIGWITASILLFAIILGVGMDLAPDRMPMWIFTLQKYTLLVGSIAVSLFLIANYSVILDRKLSYAHLIGQYAILTAVVVVLFELFVEHYAIVPDGLTGEELIIAVEEKLRIVTGWGFGKLMVAMPTITAALSEIMTEAEAMMP